VSGGGLDQAGLAASSGVVGHWTLAAGLEGQERTNSVRLDLGGRHARHPYPRRLVTLADAAALAVSTRTVRRYIADGQLEAVRLGRKTLRIEADSIERFIDAKPVGNWQ